jgi:hypothetical protein
MAYRDDRVAMLARVDALERALDDADSRTASVELERDALAAEAALLRAALVRAVASRGRGAPPAWRTTRRVPRQRRRAPVLIALVTLVTAGFVLTGIAASTDRTRRPPTSRPAPTVATIAPLPAALGPRPGAPIDRAPPADRPVPTPTRSGPVLTPAWPLTPTIENGGPTCAAELWRPQMVTRGESPLPEPPDVRAAVARSGSHWRLHADLSLPHAYPGELLVGLSASCLLADGQLVEERTGVLIRTGDARTDVEFFSGESLTAPLACIVRGGVRFGRTTLEDRDIILADTRVD